MVSAVHAEKCCRCGKPLSKRQPASVWHDHIVCERCHAKLRALEPAMALSRAVKPELPFAKRPDAHPSRPHPGQILGRYMSAMKRTFFVW